MVPGLLRGETMNTNEGAWPTMERLRDYVAQMRAGSRMRLDGAFFLLCDGARKELARLMVASGTAFKTREMFPGGPRYVVAVGFRR